MSSCKRFAVDLIPYLSDDLPETARAELEAHLQVCERCRQQVEELRAFSAVLPAKPVFEPDEAMLETLRHAVSLKIRAAREPRQRSRWAIFSFIQPAPAFQLGFAVLLLAFGFLLGRTVAPPAAQTPALSLVDLITASSQIKAANSTINPFLLEIDRLKYNPSTGEIEIKYNTVNDISLSGDLRSPAIRQMLQMALQADQNVTVRLHAVKALAGMVSPARPLETDMLEVLENLLRREHNQGIKLQALRVLQALPLTPAVKNLLLTVFLMDRDTALRIAAFRALTSDPDAIPVEGSLLQAAARDSVDFIKYRAEKLLQVRENRTAVRPAGPVELRRE